MLHAVSPLLLLILTMFITCSPYLTEIGIMMNNNIPATMKNKTYNVTVAYSTSGILACECDCKAGSTGLDKVVCVHVLPVLMQLAVLLIEDLGENMLVELCNRWNRGLDEKYQSDLPNIISAIIQIMKGIGCSSNDINAAKLAPTVQQMLVHFCVGTEKKKNIPLPPRDDMLCPMSSYESESTSKSLKKVLTKKRRKNNVHSTLPSQSSHALSSRSSCTLPSQSSPHTLHV